MNVQLYDNNSNLYKSDKKLFLESLNYAKTLTNKPGPIKFHCFWRVPRDFERKQLAVLKSIIVAHKDNLDSLEINLWSNVDLSENPHFKTVSKYVKFKLYDVQNEVKGTVLEDFKVYDDNGNLKILDNTCYLESDLFRILILHKYGGFYIDMDVLVLRNMLPLNNLEFVYQWTTTGFDGTELNTNGAIMRLNKGSALSKEMMELVKSISPRKDTCDWSSSLYQQIEKNKILVLPSAWLNSEWAINAYNDPFGESDNIELYDGAFTYHWHNKWQEPIHERSKFYLIEQMHDKIFKTL